MLRLSGAIPLRLLARAQSVRLSHYYAARQHGVATLHRHRRQGKVTQRLSRFVISGLLAVRGTSSAFLRHASALLSPACRPLGLACIVALVVTCHGWLLVAYWAREEPPPLKKAIPLPTIDVAFAAPSPTAVSLPLDESSPVLSKPLPRPEPLPVKKRRSKPVARKVTLAPSEPGQEGPAPVAAPLIAPLPAQERVIPPPPEIFTPASTNADYLRNPSPEYPGSARSRRWEGDVLLRVYVEADGRCGAISVQQSSGHEVLDQAALDAVSRWRFVPAKRGEQAVASWVTVPISFNLTP